MNNSQEQNENSKPWLYKKGQSGNPGGRPKGSKSLKTYIKERFERMSDEEKEEFLDGLPKDVIWKMGEGNPKQDTDTHVDGNLTINWNEHNDTLQSENADEGISQL